MPEILSGDFKIQFMTKFFDKLCDKRIHPEKWTICLDSHVFSTFVNNIAVTV